MGFVFEMDARISVSHTSSLYFISCWHILLVILRHLTLKYHSMPISINGGLSTVEGNLTNVLLRGGGGGVDIHH